MNLPANVYTQWYWKIDLHNLLHFLRLRADPHAQYEIRAYAEVMCEIVKDWVPLAYAAFEDYRLGETIRHAVPRTLSGGEQQMTAIGRALMSRPETILLDEPSMGLAPQLVEQIFDIVKSVNENEGVTFLLAEQNTNVALRFAHYGYILESGRVVMDGPAAELRENPDVKEFYLGMSEEGRKSFRDVRSYRRRKRWLS